MSLDISLVLKNEVFDGNITHNLEKMAAEAGIYDAVWRPEEVNILIAQDLIPILEKGIAELESNPEKYKKFEPENKWGTYAGFIAWLKRYLWACKKYPSAYIEVDR
jgi:hypothetical protein